MSVSALSLPFWESDPVFQSLVLKLKKADGGDRFKLTGLVSPAHSSFLVELYHQLSERSVLYISTKSDPAHLHKLSNQLKRISPDLPVRILPASRVSPFEGLSEGEAHFSQIVGILGNWIEKRPSFCLCTPEALTQCVLSRKLFEEATLSLHVGKEYPFNNLVNQLVKLGYMRQDTVLDLGTFAVRGNIIDLYPPGTIKNLPVRLSFDDERLESIRFFEPWSQRSLPSGSSDLRELRVCQRFPFLMPEDPSLLRDRLLKLADELDQVQKHFWLEDLKRFETDWQRFLPWLIAEPNSPLSYFDGLVVVDEPLALTAKLKELSRSRLQDLSHKLERKMLPLSQKAELESFAAIGTGVEADLCRIARLDIHLSEFEIVTDQMGAVFDLKGALVPQFRADLTEAKSYLQAASQAGQKVWLVSDLPETKTLSEDGGQIQIIQIPLERGFQIGSQIILTDFELYNRKATANAHKKTPAYLKDFIPIDLNSIRPGDYIVHLKHGIGRCKELRTLTLDNLKREYLTIEYHNQELLNVPVEQMNLISLYRGAIEDPPRLMRLGGHDWERTKRNVRASVQKVAEDLIELYAERALAEGFNFGPDTPWQTELEDSFPYQETADQLRAIQEIKADMESGQIMERLLCGDVGFGKTEVIIRTAFKVIMAGKQVAVLAPTTILAHQHFRSFQERFAKFPVRMALLSRAKTAPEKKKILAELMAGELDLLIGTHSVLGSGVKFKDLGLIVVDEEQKFGVNHKEKLKKLRSNVSVLTVSATPIPRTMHMALSGIREMSLIGTPPPGRVPIKTQILPNDNRLIRAAILRELERGGQVFYLHNRVETIERKAVELLKLVPEASFRIAHGQMSEGQVSEVMESFVNHEFDVLIATSIIENGLDIPNANTMIIEHAERLGLGQLYQLRGRVGRSNDPSRPGFALLLHPPKDSLTEQARARLETIARYSGLGSGYQIALRDLEIRGAGNLVGSAQHGKIVSVGYELYCELLNEAIQELKDKRAGSLGEPLKPKTKIEDRPVIDLKCEAFIPESWIAEDSLRLREYQRLAEVESLLMLDNLSDEWGDRFGELPAPARDLIQVVRVRILAGLAGLQGLIRPRKDMLELSGALDFKSWRQLQSVLPQWLNERVAFRFIKEGGTQLLIKLTDLSATQQLSLLEELFSLIIRMES
ncbi:MAG: transcription-repair coupling factor [Candidatus Caenarcaniphilales bacterium]|nr:transcription-repair coupling factor [Candidatus Caenarcaniphilales bacterium]